jgi:hypothetical protein
MPTIAICYGKQQIHKRSTFTLSVMKDGMNFPDDCDDVAAGADAGVLVLVLVLVAPITDWRKYPYRRRQSAYQ